MSPSASRFLATAGSPLIHRQGGHFPGPQGWILRRATEVNTERRQPGRSGSAARRRLRQGLGLLIVLGGLAVVLNDALQGWQGL